MLELICTYDENDFAFYDVDGEGGQCIESKKVEIRTCANKAIYLAAKRVLEKWIESEHFKFGTEADDCMWVTPWVTSETDLNIRLSFSSRTFHSIQSCFVSSAMNCTSPKARNLVSSGFQILGEEDEANCIYLILFGSG